MSDTPVLDYNIGRMLRAKFQREDMGCSGKEAFESRSMANELAKRLSHNHRVSMNSYRCRHCGKFHVGSTKWLQPGGKRD